MAKLAFSVVERDGKFITRDSEGMDYGPACDTEKAAEEVKQDWENYYNEVGGEG